MPGGCPFMAPLPPWGAGICYCGALPEADLLVGQQAILGAVGHLVVLLVVPAVLLAVDHLVGPLGALPKGLAAPRAAVAAARVIVVAVRLVGVPLRCFCQLGWIWVS